MYSLQLSGAVQAQVLEVVEEDRSRRRYGFCLEWNWQAIRGHYGLVQPASWLWTEGQSNVWRGCGSGAGVRDAGQMWSIYELTAARLEVGRLSEGLLLGTTTSHDFSQFQVNEVNRRRSFKANSQSARRGERFEYGPFVGWGGSYEGEREQGVGW